MPLHPLPGRSHGAAVIGVVHLRPLPGSPGYGGTMATVRSAALRDAEALAEGGVDAILVENAGDAPFWPQRVPPIVVSHMTVLAHEIRAAFGRPIGINVLRNDGGSALAIAHAVGADFIRVNVLCGAVLTDQGIIQAITHELMRDRALIAAEVGVWADVHVKHGVPIAPRPLADEARDAIDRGLADAVIVTGATTGRPVNHADLVEVRAAACNVPVLVGSGATAENAASMIGLADGFIVGTALKRDGRIESPVDSERVRRFLEAVGRRQGPPSAGTGAANLPGAAEEYKMNDRSPETARGDVDSHDARDRGPKKDVHLRRPPGRHA